VRSSARAEVVAVSDHERGKNKHRDAGLDIAEGATAAALVILQDLGAIFGHLPADFDVDDLPGLEASSPIATGRDRAPVHLDDFDFVGVRVPLQRDALVPILPAGLALLSQSSSPPLPRHSTGHRHTRLSLPTSESNPSNGHYPTNTLTL